MLLGDNPASFPYLRARARVVSRMNGTDIRMSCSCSSDPVRMYVCMCVHSYLPPHTLESRKRDSAQCRFRLNFADFPKNVSFKSYGVICLHRAAPASYRFFPHEISFYAGLKPIATFSLHRQGACGRQRAIRRHRLVKRHRYTITNTNCPAYYRIYAI